MGRSRVVSKSQSLAGRYASALYELAEQDKSLDDVAGDLVGFKQLMLDSELLTRLIKSPIISREDQRNQYGRSACKSKGE